MLDLIDGDVLCYFACRSRYADKNGVVQIQSEKPTFTMAQDAKYLEDSWKNLKGLVQSVLEETWATDYLMAVKSDYNYRDIIFPVEYINGKFYGYKANRVKAPEDSNLFVPELRRRLVENGMAIEATGREADDLVRMWAVQAAEQNEVFTVVTNDKDLKVIGGRFYNPKNKETIVVTPEEGLKFFYQQLLMGDPTDNIPGVLKIGPVKAAALLEPCNDEEEYQIIVVEQYQRVYEDDWRNQLLSNGKLLHIQRHESDFFTLDGWTIL